MLHEKITHKATGLDSLAVFNQAMSHVIKNLVVFPMALVLAVFGVAIGLWQLTRAEAALSGVFILWTIAVGVVGAMMVTTAISLVPNVRSWVARRKTLGDRLTSWLLIQMVLGVAVGLLAFYVMLYSPEESLEKMSSQSLMDTPESIYNEVRWRRMVNEEARKTWVFPVSTPFGVVRSTHKSASVDTSINAWSMMLGDLAIIGATPALLELPDPAIRAALAHELGHIAMSPGNSISNQANPDPYSIMACAPILALLSLVLVRIKGGPGKFLAALLLANAVVWLTVGDAGRWAFHDRQKEMIADGYASVWASPAGMAYALVASSNACVEPPTPVDRFDDHPSLPVRLAALGTSLSAVCQGLLQPQPPV